MTAGWRSSTVVIPEFHPRLLVEAAIDQAGTIPWFPAALASCPAGQWEGPAYLRFVSGLNPNQPGSDWQFEANVVLQHERFGTVVVDVLQGQRIGGIELVDRIP